MPATPVLFGSTTASLLSAPFDPQVIQLANGNILVTYSTTAYNGGEEWQGLDIIGRLFSPLGAAIGGEFPVNTLFNSHEEWQASLAALPNGGFMNVFLDVESVVINDLRIELYDASGNFTATRTVVTNRGADARAIISPVVEIASATSSLIAYVRDGTTDRVSFRIFDPTTYTFLPEQLLLSSASAAVSITSIDSCVLQNGNYVVLASVIDGTNRQIFGNMISPNGTILALPPVAETIDDGIQDSDPSVAALTGGGFVVSWTNVGADTDVYAQIFSATGAAVGPRLAPGDSGASDNDNDSRVVPLSDGGFIIFWDDYTASGGLRGQRFNATGTEIGAEIFVPAETGTQIQATLLADGRVAVTWVDFSTPGGRVRLDIFDPRDVPNTPVYTTPTIIGTNGNDNVAANTLATVIHGWNGNDMIFGGAGADTINAGNGNDRVDGGTENDFIVGAAGNDTILGSAGDDRIYGGVGNDRMDGGAGNDLIYGVAGLNLISGGPGNDRIIGGSGADTISGGAGLDTFTGGAGADIFDFNLFAESPRTTPNVITDFQRGLDRIDLSTLDANFGIAGDQAFTVVTSAAVPIGAGQLRFAGGLVSLYVNADAVADMVIRVNGVAVLAAGDFIL